MSQPLEAMFQENPNKLINIEHTYGFDESSPLVPSSSLLREVEQFGSSMDDIMLLKEFSSTFRGQNTYLI